MPVAGAKPKPPGQAITRTKQAFDWAEVENVPYDGPVPKLFTSRLRALPCGGTESVRTHSMTKRWWATISKMPHCRLWTESDWEYALATAVVADNFFFGHNPSATELARREKVLGVTVDARRDLRIRYVDPKPAPAGDATVTRLDDYRDL